MGRPRSAHEVISEARKLIAERESLIEKTAAEAERQYELLQQLEEFTRDELG
jgi:hypothetical protein